MAEARKKRNRMTLTTPDGEISKGDMEALMSIRSPNERIRKLLEMIRDGDIQFVTMDGVQYRIKMEKIFTLSAIKF